MSTVLVGIIVLLMVATFFYFFGRAMERVKMIETVKNLRQGYKVALMAGLFPGDKLNYEKVLNDFDQLLQPYDRKRREKEQAES